MSKAINTVRITNLTAMALAFANAPPKALAKLPASTLDSLEKSLGAAAREVAQPLPTKAQQDAAVKAKESAPSGALEPIELTITTVKTATGGELHVKTPYWVPFNIKAREMLPKGSQRWDKQNEVRIVDATQRKLLLKVIEESFGQAKRPVYVTVDGKRTQVTAGKPV